MIASMSEPKPPEVCPFCKGPLPSDAPKGFCPRCLLELFSGQSGGEGQRAEVRGQTSEVKSQALDHGFLTSELQSPIAAARRIRRFGDYELLGQSGGEGQRAEVRGQTSEVKSQA